MTHVYNNELAKQIYYIRNKLQGYNRGFVSAVENMFCNIMQNEEPDGCISNTVMLYICAKFYHLNARICYGVVELSSEDMIHEIYHMWLELDDIIIDLSIYGNVNFRHPLVSINLAERGVVLNHPNIGRYNEVTGKYYRYRKDDDYEFSNVSVVEGSSIHDYMSFMNTTTDDRLWYLCCSYLGVVNNMNNLVSYLKDITEDDYITENMRKNE